MSENVIKALRSWRALVAHLPTMSDDEVEEALRTELAGKRRKSLLDRLVKRATRLTEISASSHYKEIVHGNRR